MQMRFGFHLPASSSHTLGPAVSPACGFIGVSDGPANRQNNTLLLDINNRQLIEQTSAICSFSCRKAPRPACRLCYNA